MLPPIPWNDKTVPLSFGKLRDKVEAADKCQKECEAAMMAMPTKSSGNAGDTPNRIAPAPNPPIQTVRKTAQCCFKASDSIPPGKDTNPVDTSLTVRISPTPMLFKKK